MELLFYKTSFALLLIFAIKYCHGLLPSTGHTEVCLKVPFSVDECYAASLVSLYYYIFYYYQISYNGNKQLKFDEER